MPNLGGFLYLNRRAASASSTLRRHCVPCVACDRGWRRKLGAMNSFSISLPSVLPLPFSPAITFTTMINAAPAPASNHLRRSGAAAKSLLSAPIVFTLALIVVFAPPLHRLLLPHSIYA